MTWTIEIRYTTTEGMTSSTERIHSAWKLCSRLIDLLMGTGCEKIASITIKREIT